MSWYSYPINRPQIMKGSMSFLTILLSMILSVVVTYAGDKNEFIVHPSNDVDGSIELPEKLSITETPGLRMYSPLEFFKQRQGFDEMPEMDQMNSVDNDEIRRLANSLAANGQAVGVGFSPNMTSFFDLYMPYTRTSLEDPAPIFGNSVINLNTPTEVGKLNLLTHDSAHLYAGIPGPRSSDLKTLESRWRAKSLLTKILIEKEVFAVTWSGYKHLKWYWDWRQAKENDGKLDPEFEKLNQGMFFVGPISLSEFTDFVYADQFAQADHLIKVLREKSDVDHFEAVKKIKAPQMQRTPSWWPTWMSAFFIKTAMPSFYGWYATARTRTGYKKSLVWASEMFDYYFSDWYVEWAELFEIGVPLEQLDKEVTHKLELLRNNQAMTEYDTAPQPYEFEFKFLRSELAYFGRKFVELKELGRRNPGLYSAHRLRQFGIYLARAVERAKRLDLIIKRGAYSEARLKWHKQDIEKLFLDAKNTFPVDQIIPMHLRVPYADYRNFWFDSFAVILPRSLEMRQFVSSASIAEASAEVKARRLRRRFFGLDPDLPSLKLSVEDGIDVMQRELAEEYWNYKTEDQGLSPDTAVYKPYLARLEDFKKNFNRQIVEVVAPQVVEMTNLSSEQRRRVGEILEKLRGQVNKELNILSTGYQANYQGATENPDSRRDLVRIELHLNLIVDQSFIAFERLLETGNVDAFERFQHRVFAGDIPNGRVPTKFEEISGRVLRKLSSVGRYLWTSMTGQRLNKDEYFGVVERLRKDVFGVLPKDVQVNAQTELPELEGTSDVVIVPISHDQRGSLNKVARVISRKLGVTKTLVVTPHGAVPLLEVMQKVKQPSYEMKSSGMFSKPVLKEIQKEKGPMAIILLPEGVETTKGAQMPLITKRSAFAELLRLREKMYDDQKLYLVEAHSNALDQRVNPEIDLSVDLFNAGEVPASGHEMDPGIWVDRQRESFETRANSYRGVHMTDLVSRMSNHRQKGLRASRVNPYKSVTEFVDHRARLAICQKIFE